MTKTATDIVTGGNGSIYSLADLAHYLDDDARESVHLELAPCAPQTYWDAVIAHYPQAAQDAEGLAPVIS